MTAWKTAFSAAVAAALDEFLRKQGRHWKMLAVDCQPWDGFLELALLPKSQWEGDPDLAQPEEMAAWKHYGFTRELAAWKAVGPLAEDMQKAYNEALATGTQAEVARTYLSACAEAIADPIRRDQLAGIEVSVAHPDSGEEFFAAG